MEQTNQDALQLILDEIKARNHPEVRLMKRVRLNTFELAIKLLQDEYESRLSEGHFLVAVEFLDSESKASIFITLKSRLRDQWLSKNAGIELIDELFNS
jgi:hypothetical protein